VRGLIIANGLVYLLQLGGANPVLLDLFGLDTARVFSVPMPWQLVTYLFLHGGVFHFLFNMLGLWMFGSEVEEHLGRREFLAYYFTTGIAAGLAAVGVDALLGASGSVFGLLMAYGILWARRPITLLIFLVLPVTLEARVFVAVFAVVELIWGVSGTSRAANFAHLGGMAMGLVWFKLLRAPLRPLLHGRGVIAGLFTGWRARGEEDDRENLNRILDKINRHGIHTLTDGERRFLDRMSRRKA
jgi:membrane associated rhomboid family serine protease